MATLESSRPGSHALTFPESWSRNLLPGRDKRTFCPREASDDARMMERYRSGYFPPRPPWVDARAKQLLMDVSKP
jgi:hypothetical protein